MKEQGDRFVAEDWIKKEDNDKCGFVTSFLFDVSHWR